MCDYEERINKANRRIVLVAMLLALAGWIVLAIFAKIKSELYVIEFRLNGNNNSWADLRYDVNELKSGEVLIRYRVRREDVKRMEAIEKRLDTIDKERKQTK